MVSRELCARPTQLRVKKEQSVHPGSKRPYARCGKIKFLPWEGKSFGYPIARFAAQTRNRCLTLRSRSLDGRAAP